MVSKEDIVGKAKSFLEVVSREAQARLGDNITVVQEARWWSVADPNAGERVEVRAAGTSIMMQHGGHQREVFNFSGVNTLYQDELRDSSFPEQTELHATIIAAGIEARWISFGFLLPLVHAWCKLPEPLDLDSLGAQELLDTFANAVIEHKGTTTYRDALVYIDLGGEAVVFDEGIVLRPISEDELYELSQQRFPVEPYAIQFNPSDRWAMLEIQMETPFVDTANVSETIYRMREAIIAGLALAKAGDFILLPVGMETNFGTNATGRSISGSQLPREFGRRRVASELSADSRQKLTDMWPRVKEVMMAESHPLALPLRRLVDGLGRYRMDDRLIDYAIGLEALLLEGAEGEYRYRFSLRGAVISTWSGGDRYKAFQELQVLYDARSALVHGGAVSSSGLRSNSENGERFLREVWEWHLAQGLTLHEAMSRIDQQINRNTSSQE